MFSASVEELVPEPLTIDEWIIFADFGIQAWFSQGQMAYGEAVTYCKNMGSTLFEPYTQDLLEVIGDAARRAGLVRIWIGISDVAEEGVYVHNHTVLNTIFMQ